MSCNNIPNVLDVFTIPPHIFLASQILPYAELFWNPITKATAVPISASGVHGILNHYRFRK